MSATATVFESNVEIDINDPRFDAILNIPDILPVKSLQAIHLQDLTLTAKARALEDCREYVFLYKCAIGHTWPVALTCHQRYCPGCAKRIAEGHVDTYLDIDLASKPLLFIEITGNVDQLSGEAIGKFNSQIGKGFTKLSKSSSTPIGCVYNTVVPSKGHLTARLILWGDGTQSNARYCEAWPGKNVRVSVRPSHQFGVTLRQCFDPCLPASGIERAECEFHFEGKRSVHAMGDQPRRLTVQEKARAAAAEAATALQAPAQPEIASLPASHLASLQCSNTQGSSANSSGTYTYDFESEELIPGSTPTGNNSSIVVVQAPKNGHRCPKCQLPAVEMSEKIRFDEARDPHPLIKWFNVR